VVGRGRNSQILRFRLPLGLVERVRVHRNLVVGEERACHGASFGGHAYVYLRRSTNQLFLRRPVVGVTAQLVHSDWTTAVRHICERALTTIGAPRDGILAWTTVPLVMWLGGRLIG